MTRRINIYPSPVGGRALSVLVNDNLGLRDSINPTLVGGTPTQPSGPTYDQYQTISAGTSNKLTNYTGGKIISMPNSTSIFASDFVQPAGAAPNGNNYGAFVQASTKGIEGSDRDLAILEIAQNTMSQTSANKIPSQAQGGTNPLAMMEVRGSTYLKKLTIRGTTQVVAGVARLFNGIFVYQQVNVDHSDLLVYAVPGLGSANPDETFTIDDYQCQGNSYTRVELDGRDAQGNPTAATLHGINKCTGTDWTDCYWHDAKYGYGSSVWQSTGVFNYTRVRSEDNLVPYNFEKNDAATIVNMYGCTYLRPKRSTPCHMIADSDLGSMKINIFDPVFTSIPAYPGKFVIQLHTYYPSAPTLNVQKVSDIKIFQAGIDVTGDGNGSGLLKIIH